MDWFANFGMREWLIFGGILLVLLVLVDGFRRMRSERKEGLKMSLGMGGGFPEDTGQDPNETYGAELPNGGARVINRRDPIISDQGADDLSFLEAQSQTQHPPQQPTIAKNTQRQSAAGQKVAADNMQSPTEKAFQLNTNSEFVVMHVKSENNDGFNGSDLLQILLACDLRYGDRDILHRHEKAEGKGCLQFSVANMIEPGTFSLEDINSFRTPGVTFFMTLPGPEDPIAAFDCMVETANCLVKNLDATLYDEDHTTATPQLMNLYQERVKQFSNIGNPEPL